jgi:hypothetical protein
MADRDYVDEQKRERRIGAERCLMGKGKEDTHVTENNCVVTHARCLYNEVISAPRHFNWGPVTINGEHRIWREYHYKNKIKEIRPQDSGLRELLRLLRDKNS